MTETEMLLKVRGLEMARLQRRLHLTRERYKKVRDELRRCLYEGITTTRLIEQMRNRVTADKTRMDRIAQENIRVAQENIRLHNQLQELTIFIEGARGKYL